MYLSQSHQVFGVLLRIRDGWINYSFCYSVRIAFFLYFYDMQVDSGVDSGINLFQFQECGIFFVIVLSGILFPDILYGTILILEVVLMVVIWVFPSFFLGYREAYSNVSGMNDLFLFSAALFVQSILIITPGHSGSCRQPINQSKKCCMTLSFFFCCFTCRVTVS